MIITDRRKRCLQEFQRTGVEDMILVTETGAESLTNFPRDLFEI